MSLVIRLTQTGKKGERKYRIVVKEKRSKRQGEAVEILGWYEKTTSTVNKKLDSDRIAYWVSKGAQLTPAVRDIVEDKKPEKKAKKTKGEQA